MDIKITEKAKEMLNKINGKNIRITLNGYG